jgi:hypothetical protein
VAEPSQSILKTSKIVQLVIDYGDHDCEFHWSAADSTDRIE